MNTLLSSVFQQNITQNQSYQETRKVQKVVSEMKRSFVKACTHVGDAIRNARRNHEKVLKAYEVDDE